MDTNAFAKAALSGALGKQAGKPVTDGPVNTAKRVLPALAAGRDLPTMEQHADALHPVKKR